VEQNKGKASLDTKRVKPKGHHASGTGGVFDERAGPRRPETPGRWIEASYGPPWPGWVELTVRNAVGTKNGRGRTYDAMGPFQERVMAK